MLTKCNLYIEYYSHIGFRVLIIGNITLVEDDTILRKISHEWIAKSYHQNKFFLCRYLKFIWLTFLFHQEFGDNN